MPDGGQEEAPTHEEVERLIRGVTRAVGSLVCVI